MKTNAELLAMLGEKIEVVVEFLPRKKTRTLNIKRVRELEQGELIEDGDVYNMGPVGSGSWYEINICHQSRLIGKQHNFTNIILREKKKKYWEE